MSKLILIPEPISRNVFEQYYRLIEHLKNPITEKRVISEEDQITLNAFDYLEKVVSGIERCIQDVTSNEHDELRHMIANTTTELLDSWLLVLASYQTDNPETGNDFIDAFTYNFLPIISILKNYKPDSYTDALRYLSKTNSGIENSPLVKELTYAKSEHQIGRFTAVAGTSEMNSTIAQVIARALRGSEISKELQFDYRQLDPTDLSSNIKASLFFLSRPILDRIKEDYFNYKALFEVLRNIGDIEEIRQRMQSFDFTEPFEKLFFFDDTVCDAVWDVKIIFSNKENQYNAAEIGFSLWSFAKALESIDDVEVELIECGEGSKWFNLKIRIKSLASKVDVVQVFKKFRQSVEVVYTKKPLDEIQKFEAEKNKLNAEAYKVQKEANNIIDESKAEILHDLSIHEKILDLQKKEVEIEEKKAEVRIKNLDYAIKLSEFMKNGMIENNSDIKMYINGIVFMDKGKDQIAFENEDLLDVDEKLELKNRSNVNPGFGTGFSQEI